MYYSGMSFRRVADFFAVAMETIRYWWNRLAFLLDYVRGPHGVVVADETKILVGKRSAGETWTLWVAIDATTLQVVNAKFARHQQNLDCRDFLEEIRHKSRPESPILIHDLGPWYAIQAEKIGLAHQHVRGGVRSLVECWNRQLKHRLDGFWRVFPWNARAEQMERWLRSYAAVWNITRGW